jgi:hypothetical protein
VALNDLSEFKSTGKNWKIARDVFYDFKESGKAKLTSGTGILVNTPSDNSKDHLFLNLEHGDIDIELDFMMEKNSNAGVYLQGRYEIQMFDSWGVSPSKSTDCGAIYERWDEKRPEGRQGYEGHPPSQNVSRAPGLWQHYRIEFRAPRFNAKNEKIENARFLKVVHNGVVIHENVEVTGPTRAAAFQDEKSMGPLMIQGDHGPVAIRNIKYKVYGSDNVTLSDLKLTPVEGKFSSVAEVLAAKPSPTIDIDLLQHTGTEAKDTYGGKITGTMNIPKSGPYHLDLNLKWIPEDINKTNPNGGGELKIDGQKVMTIDGSKVGKSSAVVELKEGSHPIELTYFKKFKHWYQPANDIVLGVEAPGISHKNLNAVLLFAEATGAISVPVASEPVMVRSFVNHNGIKKTHVISLGDAGKVNYSYDLKSGSLLQCWRGDFVETTLMWHDRGEPQLAEPLGSILEFSGKPTVALLSDKNMTWPDSNATYNYRGYDISKSGHPIVKYSIGESQITESITAEDSGKRLSHNIAVVSSAAEVWCRIASADAIVKLPNGLYAINDKEYLIQLPDKAEPLIRTIGGKSELLLPINVKATKGALKYSIIW